MNTSEKIHIVSATDNHYAILLAVLIKSIYVNHKSAEQIEFYVIDNGISQENIERLKSLVDPKSFAIHFCKMKDVLPSNMSLPIDGTGMPQITYMRMFAPYIVPPEAKKVLYLDVDMVVVEDIAKLWHSDLGDSIVGCVQDHSQTVSCSWAGIPNYKELGLHPDTKYFNAGLLLIDVEEWKKENIPHQILKCVEDNKKSLLLADQYALNVVFANKWHELDPKWNCKAGLEIENPYLIHFIDIKPIYDSYNGNKAFQQEFFKYLAMTPWKDTKPVSNYVRLARKGFYKIKKTVSKLFRNK